MRFPFRRRKDTPPPTSFYPIVLLEHVDPFISEKDQEAYIRESAAELRKRCTEMLVVLKPEAQEDSMRTADRLAIQLGLQQARRGPNIDGSGSPEQLQQCVRAVSREGQTVVLVASRTFNTKVASHASPSAGKLKKLSTFILHVVGGDSPYIYLQRID